VNPWFRDPRLDVAEADAFNAERAERRGDLAGARALYHRAADAFVAVAFGVPSDHPNTRSDIAIAAVASLARAGDFGAALEVARRFLAEPGSLVERGRTDLEKMVVDYSALTPTLAPTPIAKALAGERGEQVRRAVRERFRNAA
jgi:hypothetical protein